SQGPFKSLNLGILTDDDPGSVAENRRRLAAVLGLSPERVAVARQVHGGELIAHAAPQAARPIAQPGGVEPAGWDGHLTAEPGLAPVVFVADCLPVALAGP